MVERILERDPQQPVLLVSEYVGAEIAKEAERLGVPLIDKLSGSGVENFLEEVKRLLEKRPCSDQDRRLANGKHGENNRRASDKEIKLISPHVAAARAAAHEL